MKYTLQIKTGDAEYRALKNIPKEIFANPNFRLLIEITRGRKSKNRYPHSKRRKESGRIFSYRKLN